jgi:RNA polymerase sigma-70 factor (ECF subfamily)
MLLASGELGTATKQERASRPALTADRHPHLEFGARLMEHLPTLRARARGLERSHPAADDLVQDTIERALRKFRRFEPGTDLRRWLLVMMHNLFADRWRERCRARVGACGDLADVAAAPSPGDDGPVPSRSAVATVADVRQALALVAEPLRTTFELRFFQRLSYQEVATRTGVPIATVGTRIMRARLRITSVVDQNSSA